MAREARRHVALIGLRGSGKSTVGALLARALQRIFVDLDDEIAREYARAKARPSTRARSDENAHASAPSAGEILARIGEPAFRDLEESALERVLAREEPLVIATGGGVVESAENRERLARSATCVWLRVEVHELERRLEREATLRPSLTGAGPAAEIRILADRRNPLYAQAADLALDCGDRPPEAVAGLVIGKLREPGG